MAVGHFGVVARPAPSTRCAQVEHWAAYFENSAIVPIPTLDYARVLAARNLAYSPRIALVHGDYRIGNFMIVDGRIVSVFDWELAHVGDPVEDIAYSGLPLFRGRNPMLSGRCSTARNTSSATTSRSTGLPSTRRSFTSGPSSAWSRQAASHVRGSRAFEDGRGDDLRLAAMGHQVQFVSGTWPTSSD